MGSTDARFAYGQFQSQESSRTSDKDIVYHVQDGSGGSSVDDALRSLSRYSEEVGNHNTRVNNYDVISTPRVSKRMEEDND